MTTNGNDAGNRLASQLRTAVWHLRRGGISQLKSWRRRENYLSRRILTECSLSSYNGKILQIDLLVRILEKIDASLDLEATTYDSYGNKLTSVTKPVIDCIQGTSNSDTAIHHMVLLIDNHENAETLVVALRGSHLPDIQIVYGPNVKQEFSAVNSAKLDHGFEPVTAVELVDEEFAVPPQARAVRFNFHVQGSKHPGKQVLRVVFQDDFGNELLPSDDTMINEEFGAYTLVKSRLEPNQYSSRSTTIPRGATRLVLTGISFSKSVVFLRSSPYPEWLAEDIDDTLSEFLEEADHSDLVVVDSTAPAVSDKSRALRPNNLAMELADRGLKVIFFPFGRLGEFSMRPHKNIFQTSRQDFQDVMNEVISRRIGQNNTYCCTSFSSVAAVATFDLVQHYGWKTVYEVRDDMEEFNRVGYSKWYSPMLEKRAIERADTIISVSPFLASKLRSLVPTINKEIHVLPNAAPVATVKEGEPLRSASDWNNRSFKVGYVGHLTESWFDWSLLLQAARKMPDISFEIIGHGFPNSITLPDNAIYLGPKTHTELLDYVKDWRVGIIPFISSPLALGVDPNKLFEYASWGLRTVSAPMGSVDTAPSTYVYETQEEFNAALVQAVEKEMSLNEMQALDEFAVENTWSRRADQILAILNGGK